MFSVRSTIHDNTLFLLEAMLVYMPFSNTSCDPPLRHKFSSIDQKQNALKLTKKDKTIYTFEVPP